MSAPRPDSPPDQHISDLLANLTPAKAREIASKLEERFLQLNQRSATQISQFRDELKAMDGATLNSVAKAITMYIVDIRKKKPEEKIIVVSVSDKFLDEMAEALEREFRKDEAIRYSIGRLDNTTLSSNNYETDLPCFEVQRRLNDPSDDLGIVLLSVLAEGWQGMSLTGASTMLLCDPIWWHNVYVRLVGLIRRLGQTRPTSICNFTTSGGIGELTEAVREKSQVGIYW